MNHNGPAFPESSDTVSGMTLRDWFAGQALVGLLSDSTLMADQHEFARSAYKIADAMLEERSKK